MTIRVLLADDQALLRGTFKMLFDSADDMETVGEAANGREAVDLSESLHPDVVLMDIRMPEMDGLDATRLISESEDLAGVKVLILTTFEDDEHVAEALRAGASGFLGKGVRP
ncbi:response regulator transcription factor, partial [Streptomyces sp. NPDC056728]